MFTPRPARQRGHFDHGWLDTWHTFSFGEYRDPNHRQYRALRVMNEDRVAPGQGFGMHPHRDMEIVTYVLSGTLAHRDSLGNEELLRAGEVQRMTAGTGILHSEYNASADEPVHLYQIWLYPERPGLPPSYEQRPFARDERRARWQTIVAPDRRDGALALHQDAALALVELQPGESIDYALRPGRHAWLQVLRGSVRLGELELAAGDGVACDDEPRLTLRAVAPSEALLFDLA